MIKGVPDNVHIPNVHVHQVLLLLVVVHNLVQSDSEQFGWIGELSGTGSALGGVHVLSAGSVLSLVLILLLELDLQVSDSVLKVELVKIVLSLKSQNLIVGILGAFG